ncbi:hypothetical protein HPB49_011706 [Dermacentor silvarum]|uniref:Uncharacterized protein n=1 Tax=Dermacentor silvarum TaxID=543639 RepID=A0ACB8C939_DERSI|nr:hypothetical protein HPB49_011706 [Dermacentor silvarum]
MADFTAPSCGPPRKGHRRSASATVDMPQSLGLELRHRDAARARAADIVDQWLARRGAATRRPSAPAASVTCVPVPSGEVPNDLPLTTPAPAALQPMDTFEPVTVELPVTSDEGVMDESTSRKRGRDSEDEEEVFKQSKGLGALPDSKRNPLTLPSGSAAGERAPDAATAAPGTVGPAASTPTAEKTASTAVPGKPATTPTGVTASLEMAEPRQLEPHRKGGHLIFLEHIAFPRGTWQRALQNLMTPLWMFFCCNCHLNRDSAELIEAAGFSHVSVSYVNVEIGLVLNNQAYGFAIA